MPEIVVLGAGLAGLGAAAELGTRGALYERQPAVGGLCQQVGAGGFRADAVPHVLHFQHDANRVVASRLLRGQLDAFRRDARVYCSGRYIRYPFQAHLFGLPDDVRDDCVRGRLAVARSSVDTSTFEQWITSQFGDGIARHFMRPYNTKFWTLPPSELTCEWLDGLVPVPTADQTCRGATVADPTEYGYNTEFWYPRTGGIGALLEALAARAPQVHVGQRVTRIDMTAKHLHLADGQRVTYDRMLSSIPLPELRGLLDPLPPDVAEAFAVLRWIGVIVVHLGVRGPAPAPWHWVYVPQDDLIFYRVGLPSHYAADAAPEGHHLIAAEISFSSWAPPDRASVVAKTIQGLQRMGMLDDPRDIAMTATVEQRYGYPIYDRRYAWATTTIRGYLAAHHIVGIGRFGSWRYLSIEQTLAEARRVAAALASQPRDAALPR